MHKLSAYDLYSLEQYHHLRDQFRARILEHKKRRQIPLGPIATLYFEDRLTIQYQVQEMLRIERIFETEAIEEELAAYNPLIPDGRNFKATFMIEVPDPEERRRELARLNGIEDKLYMQVDDMDRVYAIADEDMDRRTEDKTSAVHFVRFEVGAEMVAPLKHGASLTFGVDHPGYAHENALSEGHRLALVADLD